MPSSPASSSASSAPAPAAYTLRRRQPGAPCRVRLPALDVELTVPAAADVVDVVPPAVVAALAADASLAALFTWTPWTPETGASRQGPVVPSDTPAQE